MTAHPVLLKALRRAPDGTLHSAHGGSQVWVPGQWVTAPGPLQLCAPGTLHACRWGTPDLLSWLTPEVWLAESEGAVIDGYDKIGTLRLRITTRCDWDATAAWLFAADCAERVLPLFEQRFPNDRRPRQAIEATRKKAAGIMTDDSYADAADAADAAYDAYAAYTYAAGAADAAYDAYAAYADERRWQAGRLVDYLTGWRPPAWHRLMKGE